MANERDTSKLPKWAQDRIALAERNVEYWKGKAQGGPEDSDTFVDAFLGEGKPLGRGPRIQFKVNDRKYFDVWLAEGNVLNINASETVHIVPHGSNAVKIIHGEWV